MENVSRRITEHRATTLTAVRLFDLLPIHPVVTLPNSIALLQTSKPTAGKAIDALCRAHVLKEITGKRRDRVYAYRTYLDVLSKDTGNVHP